MRDLARLAKLHYNLAPSQLSCPVPPRHLSHRRAAAHATMGWVVRRGPVPSLSIPIHVKMSHFPPAMGREKGTESGERRLIKHRPGQSTGILSVR